MTILVVFEQLSIFLVVFQHLFLESCLNDDLSCVLNNLVSFSCV